MQTSAPLTFKNLSAEQSADLLPSGLIFLGYRGSIAHGMYVPKNDPKAIDDKDIMGVFVGPPEHYLGFGRADVHERFIGEWDAVSYEIRKLFSLLLKGNPNVLSLLWLDQKNVLYQHLLWQHVIDAKEMFVSKQVYHSFVGYAYGQMKKMTAFGEKERGHLAHIEGQLTRRGIDLAYAAQASPDDIAPTPPDTKQGDEVVQMNNRDLVTHYQKQRKKYFAGYMGEKRKSLVTEHGYDTKNAAHLIRLLRMSIEFMTEGQLYVERADAQDLLAIKRGERSLEDVRAEAERLFALAEEAYIRSHLPTQPKRDAAEQLLIQLIHDYHA